VVVELLLVRHALPMTILQAEGPADPGLTPSGHRQAADLAAYLAGQHVDLLVTSPLRRAAETARPVAEALGLTPEACDDLAESDRYSHTYVPMEEMRRDRRLAAAVAAAVADQPHETREEFDARVCRATERVIEANPGRRVVVVGHGGVINAYLASILGLERDVFFEPRYASISRVLASRRGHRNIDTLNETHFLRPPGFCP
jgi:2,3-bisphosphoglycerate-dependent phosphoglycerate mutase